MLGWQDTFIYMVLRIEFKLDVANFILIVLSLVSFIVIPKWVGTSIGTNDWRIVNTYTCAMFAIAR